MTDYHVGKFIIINAVGKSEPKVPALVIGVEQTVTVITPWKVIRTFKTKDFNPEFLNEDGSHVDLGDELVTDVLRSKEKSTNTSAKKAQQSGQKS